MGGGGGIDSIVGMLPQSLQGAPTTETPTMSQPDPNATGYNQLTQQMAFGNPWQGYMGGNFGAPRQGGYPGTGYGHGPPRHSYMSGYGPWGYNGGGMSGRDYAYGFRPFGGAAGLGMFGGRMF